MASLTDQEFHTLTSFLKDKYGINLTQKRVLIEGRMASVLRTRGIPDYKTYLDILFRDQTGEEITTLLNRLTTNYSFFMRENEHFEFMRQYALPYLVKHKSSNRSLRIWSAGCSSGQEPYTIAMCLNEFFGTQRSAWKIQILATDISVKVLTTAHKGIYDQDSMNEINPAWIDKYFDVLPNKQYQVRSFIRERVDFRTLNLMDDFHFRKPFDIIFCRNVMIYFDGPTKDALVQRFYRWMEPGGYFFIGHSETVRKNAANFKLIRPAIYRKEGGLPDGSEKNTGSHRR